MANLMEMSLAALTFNKGGLKKAGEQSDSTTPALLLILIASVVSGIVSYLNETSLFTTGQSDVSPTTNFVASFVGWVLIYLIVSFILALFLGKEAQTIEVFRIFGATSVWTTIGALVSLVITNGNINSIISLLGFIALIIGLSAISKKGILSVLLRVILAIILGGIIIFAIIIFLILGVLGLAQL